MKITILGCGPSAGVPLIGCECSVCLSSTSKNKRTRASIAITTDAGKVILVDASPDLRQQALACGLRRVDALILTHAHADHCHGLDDMRSFNYLAHDAIDLYADTHTLDEVRERFSYVFTPHDLRYGWYKPQFHCHNLPDHVAMTSIADVHVQTFMQHHGSVNSLGIRIGNFAYSTDVKSFPEASFAALEGLDLWIVDCLRLQEAPTHAHLDLTLAWIERLKPKRAILTHMGHELDYDVLNAQLPKGVEMGYDGMVIEVL
ncbi:MAG: MBL fold metallo-hydrolase [Alphaproteobacteria bacterium]|nr:MAG: MBL fold metallo-hydrolase [Alphaproteobacteria bacterium]TAF40962.1 MAG: MBL fold metallo-hydrolase [Alphaproteobacteria bacterium]